MGMAGAVLGGSLLGLGLSGMGKQPSFNLASDVHSSMTPSKPATPEVPVAPDGAAETGGTNALMEAERNRERQLAALRRQRAREIHTSGLGAAGLATTTKQTLLGG